MGNPRAIEQEAKKHDSGVTRRHPASSTTVLRKGRVGRLARGMKEVIMEAQKRGGLRQPAMGRPDPVKVRTPNLSHLALSTLALVVVHVAFEHSLVVTFIAHVITELLLAQLDEERRPLK